MKQYLLPLFALFLSVSLSAQTQPDNGRVSISAVQPEYENIPKEAQSNLETKMQRMLSTAGISSREADRFILTSRIDITSREINTSGLILQKMEITFLVGDVIEEKIYATATVNAIGAGETDTKAFIKAFQTVKPTNTRIQGMLETAKSRIYEYYTSNCQSILKDADRMCAMQQYDQAIALLVRVPDVNPECFSLCQDKAIEIYNIKINSEGESLIQQAKAAWNLKQDYDGAETALDLLAQVNPQARCVDQANQFINIINEKLRKDEARKAAAEAAAAKARWEFKMRQYEDRYALEVQKQANRSAILGTLAERFGKFDIHFRQEKAVKLGSLKN